MQQVEAGLRRPGRRAGAVVVSLALVVAACGDDGAADRAGSDAPPEERAADGGVVSGGGGDEGSVADTEVADGAPVAEDVPLLDGGRVVEPDLTSHRAEMVELADDPPVRAAVLPRPESEGNPWSQWGQGVALDDGRVVMAMGDHQGPDGDSWLFVYDPDEGTVTRFADVLSALDHQPGSWGYGKIHSQMVDAGGEGIWFTTYWGTRREMEYDDSYRGDVLFRLDPATLQLQPVAVPVELHGIPSLAGNGDGLLFGEAVDGQQGDASDPVGGFFVYDVTRGEVLRFDPDPDHDLFRNVLVDRSGSAWFARAGGTLFHYDPGADEIAEVDVDLGGGGLRASTAPTADGTVYAVTQDPDEFLAFDPDGPTVRSLGAPDAYTASLALTPDQSGFLYVPGAHGQSGRWGSPLILVDGESGEQTVLVELADLVDDEFGLVLGGTYSVTVDADRNVAHIGFNAGTDPGEPWGEVVLVEVGLP